MNSMKRQNHMPLKGELPRSVPNMLLEKSGESSRKNEEAEPKWKQCPVVYVTGDGSKIQYCKE